MPNRLDSAMRAAVPIAALLAFARAGLVAQRTQPNDQLRHEVRGLDHPDVVVHDLEAAKNTYRDRLGFSVPAPGVFVVRPSGARTTDISFADGSYVLLLAVDDLSKATRQRPEYVTFLDKHEGALYMALWISSARATAGVLRERGFEVRVEENPTDAGAAQQAQQMYATVKFARPALPGGSIFFFQSPSEASRQERIRKAVASGVTNHANTATRLRAVWIAVQDLGAATRAFESAGFHTGEARENVELGAATREIEAGSGSILLLAPKAGVGKASEFLRDRGEGIMGLSVEVGSLDTARALLQKSTNRPFEVHTDRQRGSSILIPAELAHGVWIEMVEPRR